MNLFFSLQKTNVYDTNLSETHELSGD